MFWTCQSEGAKGVLFVISMQLDAICYFFMLLLVKACHTPMKTHNCECHFFPEYNIKVLPSPYLLETCLFYFFLKGCTDLVNTKAS